MARTASATTERRTVLADAALEVLVARGARGLTHRAVDEQAGLPEGSTSNHFRTRDALMAGALERLVELDAPAATNLLEQAPPAERVPPGRAAAIATALLNRWIAEGAEARRVARYELLLESRRRPEFHGELARIRRSVVHFAEQLLPYTGCASPREHAPGLVAFVEGLLVNQVFYPDTRFDDDELRGYLELWFRAC